MQRKIDQYWKRKDNIKETVSAVASKVQRTVSDFGAQTGTISDHQSTQQEQADSILFQEAGSIIIHWSGMNNNMKNLNAKTVGCMLLTEK